MSAIGIIPARYGSTRFPGKPLVPIMGKTLIQRTYENSLRCASLDGLYVATDDERIFRHVESFGGKAIMTPADCPSGTDRLAAATAIEPECRSAEWIVNIQGDWPLLDPTVISQVIDALREGNQLMATALVKIEPEEALDNPSLVKCVVDLQGYALYFSRSVIPAIAQAQRMPPPHFYKHLGIYGYRKDFLNTYAQLSPTPLQQTEDLEQLKALEHGYRIKTVLVDHFSIGVDTPEDIHKVESILCRQNTSS